MYIHHYTGDIIFYNSKYSFISNKTSTYWKLWRMDCKWLFDCAFVCVHIYVSTCLLMHIAMCMHVCVYVCAFVCVWVHVCVHLSAHACVHFDVHQKIDSKRFKFYHKFSWIHHTYDVVCGNSAYNCCIQYVYLKKF